MSEQNAQNAPLTRQTQEALAMEELLTSIDQRDSRKTMTIIETLRDRLAGEAAPVERNRIDVTPAQEQDEPVQPPVQRMQPVGLRQPTDSLYRQIRPELKPYRNPDVDHWSQQWLLGLTRGDRALQRVAHTKIADLGYGRATWDEGTASATGGVASGEGADLLPIPLLAVVEIERDARAKIPGLSFNFQLTAQQSRIPRAGAFTVAMVAEGSTATAGEPTLDTVLPVAHKMQGKGLATDEMLADSAFNTVGIFATRAGSGMGEKEDVQACTSNGTPPNISENITTGVSITDHLGASFTFAELTALYFSVPQQYRGDAVWYGDSAALQILTNMGSDVGFPVLSTQAAVPGAITDDSSDGFVFRKPVYEVPLVAGTGTGILGLMSRSGYGWGRRSGIVASTIDDFDNDTQKFKFTQRVDGVNLDIEGRAFIENFIA